jgi:5'-nucleotidase
MPAFRLELFLSAITDVAEVTAVDAPAGQVVGFTAELAADDPDDRDLRIAFDFDAVLADDAAERVYASAGREGGRERHSRRRSRSRPER